MTGEEYIAFLRARNPEVYIQNSSGVPVKWIVTRAYINGVSAKHRVDVERGTTVTKTPVSFQSPC